MGNRFAKGFLIAASALCASALAERGLAEDLPSSSKLLEASIDRCAEVLREINTAEDFDAAKLTVASQICYVARLAEHAERERARLSADSTGQGSVRSLEDARDAEERAALLALDQLETQLEGAADRRDDLLREMSEADPHEVNDLLRRLLDTKKGDKS
jgi:hypothetical protein